MLGASLGKVLPWKAVPGAYLWLVLSLAGCSFFLLARKFLSARDAVFAAVLYATNPYHLIVVYWRSAFAELLIAAILPLLLLFVLQLEDESKNRRTCATLGLIALVAAAWLSDAPGGVIVNYSLVLLLVFFCVARHSLRPLVSGGIALVTGMALAAFYLVPAIWEQKWVDIYQAVSKGVRPVDNFLFSHAADLFHYQFNRMISIVIVTQILLLLLAAIWWRNWRGHFPQLWKALVLWAGVAALLMFRVSDFAWRILPKLEFIQFPWRWLLCFNLGFALLIAAAWRGWIVRAAVLLALVSVVVVAGRYTLPPWWDTALDVAELHENIATRIGYEGTDEYLPTVADMERVNRNARRVTYEGPGSAQIHIVQWEPEAKQFSVIVTAPGKLVLRLFYYPAWAANVNGANAALQPSPGTGQIVIPVAAGQSRVQLYFGRTWDRTAGGWISFIALLACGAYLTLGRRPGFSVHSGSHP